MKKTGVKSGQKVKKIKRQELTTEDLLSGIRNFDKAVLAKSITLIESNKPAHFDKAEKLITEALKFTLKSIRIGITGVPGVGKSTFMKLSVHI